MGMAVSGDCWNTLLTQLKWSLLLYLSAPHPAPSAPRKRALPSSSVPWPNASPPEGPTVSWYCLVLGLALSFLIIVDLTLAEC